MSSEVATQTRTPEPSRGTGKKGNRSRGPNRNQRANGGNKGKNAQSIGGSSSPGEPGDASSQVSEVVEQMSAVAVSEAGDSDICWICAEPVKYWAVPECNHRVCHVCAIRLRALYKKMECTFCKEPQAMMVFTSSPDALFASFTPETIPFKDSKLSVYFETQEMMEDTLILLRFNCPDQECDYIGNGWGDLRLHVRAVHGKLMCDLCIRNKKVFAHEHAIYPPSLLPVHLPSMQQRASKAALKEPIEGGVHPLCAFCRECFFGDDELYGHMREKHEECFICKRNEIRDQYFQNYDSLERHFSSAHYACTNAECLARKFVVFNTPLDLKAHMVEEHGGDMSSRDRKDARRVQADFTFEEVGRRRDRDRDRERDRDRDRDREPHQPRPPPAQASTPAVASARPPAPASRRREGFGGALTDSSAAQASTSNANNGRGSRPVSRPVSPPPAASSAEIDPAIAERHAAFLVRLQSLAPNPSTAVPVVKAATRGYRSSESNARDLISTIWNVMDQNLEQTASIINAFVDLLDEEEKKADLLSSWKGFAIEDTRG
ncbi:hypothetical protein NLJ89_g10589 [Agrocybe chaxingu]|uniref:RING-type E3 ubiquitin transferase n=1 Tax=Agrocybe chaxingu TaxID=84603 RepID=A0A9W8JRH8_9AGAR|nr:hypothetical protein NLJ89_g10589 [Agrocybe chaxingu]